MAKPVAPCGAPAFGLHVLEPPVGADGARRSTPNSPGGNPGGTSGPSFPTLPGPNSRVAGRSAFAGLWQFGNVFRGLRPRLFKSHPCGITASEHPTESGGKPRALQTLSRPSGRLLRGGLRSSPQRLPLSWGLYDSWFMAFVRRFTGLWRTHTVHRQNPCPSPRKENCVAARQRRRCFRTARCPQRAALPPSPVLRTLPP